MIGAKTLTALFLGVTSLVLGERAGLMRRALWAGMEPRTLFWMAVFATALATFVYRYWGLSAPSGRYFRFGRERRRATFEQEAQIIALGSFRVVTGENRGDAFELPSSLVFVAYLALAFLLSAYVLDARALDVLEGTPQHLAMSSAEFCPELGAAVAPEDGQAPGCALVRRAFELGYAKDLGECGKRRETKATSVCTLRLRDEPFAHYAYRRLRTFVDFVGRATSSENRTAMQKEFEGKAEHLEVLYDEQKSIVLSSPRASHHVFTNLPRPRWLPIDPVRCTDRYLQLPDRPESDDPGAVLEHVIAKLVFETRYAPSAGYCPEMTFHWGAPADACERLAKSPESFLKEQGAWGAIGAAVERQRLGERTAALDVNLRGHRASGTEASHAAVRDMPLERFVSVQCYVVEDRPALTRTKRSLKIFGHPLEATELRVPATPPDPHRLYVDTYRHAAELLSPSFVYGGFLSASGLEAADTPNVDASFASRDLPLTRLELLRSVDVFKEGSFATSRDDLLEVYPYGLHLSNFVRVFRGHYTRERGRL